MSNLFSVILLQATLQAMTPILLASLAGVLCARVGVFNMALEGQMLVGAFFAVVGSYYGGSALAGVAAALVAVLVFTLPLALGTTWLRGDNISICIALNLLASGLTSFLLRIVFGVSGTFSDPAILPIVKLRWLWLRNIPVAGILTWAQTPITFLSWALIAVVWFLLFRTPIGLRLRGVGERPDAAQALGVDVSRYRIVTVLGSSLLLGLAGAQLSLGTVSVFSEDMTAGRGWIALVAVMLARSDPLWAAAACLLFGFTDAIGLRLQSIGLPNQLTDIMPYVITLIVIVLNSGRSSIRLKMR
ncbi:MAG: ABC transporter permease [Rhizobiales bacterium]|nr:ABC transporter permease [Hyphomicrobiales bacterium]